MMRAVIVFGAVALMATAGPLDFGQAELKAALAARKLTLKIKAELEDLPNESFQIESTRVRGGDLRGLMYGLLEAAEQIRSTGKLKPVKISPATPLRSLRMARSDAPAREEWPAFFQMLARNRFNRFELAYVNERDYLGADGLEYLRFVAKTAADYGVEFMIGVDERPSYAGLKKMLAASPGIRSVRLAADVELCKAIRETGRLVILDLHGWETNAKAIERVKDLGVAVRVAYNEGSAGHGNFYWDVALEANPDLAEARKVVAGFTKSGSLGFEADAPSPWASSRAFYEKWGRLSFDPQSQESAPAAKPNARVAAKRKKKA